MNFLEDLVAILNKHNMSDTPDWILAQYLMACLKTFNESVVLREKWHG
jgi:hypothetical protein